MIAAIFNLGVPLRALSMSQGDCCDGAHFDVMPETSSCITRGLAAQNEIISNFVKVTLLLIRAAVARCQAV